MMHDMLLGDLVTPTNLRRKSKTKQVLDGVPNESWEIVNKMKHKIEKEKRKIMESIERPKRRLVRQSKTKRYLRMY